MSATPSQSLNLQVSWQMLFLRTLIASAGVCVATAAGANEATVTAEPAATGGLEEIVVTATRREEGISKVPISITALSQDALDQRGIRDLTELVRFTPGVSIDTTVTNQISIGGISSSAVVRHTPSNPPTWL